MTQHFEWRQGQTGHTSVILLGYHTVMSYHISHTIIFKQPEIIYSIQLPVLRSSSIRPGTHFPTARDVDPWFLLNLVYLVYWRNKLKLSIGIWHGYILVNLVSKMVISVDCNNSNELLANLTVNREMYRYKHRFFIIIKHVTDIWSDQRSTCPQL